MNPIKIKIAKKFSNLLAKVGDGVTYSPVGEGKITGITPAGYPQVNHVAVTWVINAEGAVYGQAQRLTKDNGDICEAEDLVQVIYYECVKDSGQVEEYLEGTGPYCDCYFPENADQEMIWILKFVPNQSNITEPVSNAAIEATTDSSNEDIKESNSSIDNMIVMSDTIVSTHAPSLQGAEKDEMVRVFAGWLDTLASEQKATQHYQKQLDEMGKLFGKEAYICDDGSVSDSILRAKVPELVTKAVKEATEYRKLMNCSGTVILTNE